MSPSWRFGEDVQEKNVKKNACVAVASFQSLTAEACVDCQVSEPHAEHVYANTQQR